MRFQYHYRVFASHLPDFRNTHIDRIDSLTLFLLVLGFAATNARRVSTSAKQGEYLKRRHERHRGDLTRLTLANYAQAQTTSVLKDVGTNSQYGHRFTIVLAGHNAHDSQVLEK